MKRYWKVGIVLLCLVCMGCGGNASQSLPNPTFLYALYTRRLIFYTIWGTHYNLSIDKEQKIRHSKIVIKMANYNRFM